MQLRYYFCFLAQSEIGCGFMIFSCWNYGTVQSRLGNKLNRRTRRSWARSVTFFSIWLLRIHNIMHLKIMKLSAFFIFDAKKSIKQNRQFHSVFAWDLRTILTKNKRWFPHPSETSCFCETGQNISFPFH